MAKQSNEVIKILILLFIIFFAGVIGYEYFQYGSIFNNAEHYRQIYAQALELKTEEDYTQAFTKLAEISPRYEAYDAVLFQQAQCAAKVGDEASVQKSLKALVNKYPQSYLYLPAKYDLAKSFLCSGNKDIAADTFQNIINSHPHTDFELGSYYYLGELLSKKSHPLAIKYWKKYIEQSQAGRFSVDCANNIVASNTQLTQEDNYFLGLVYYNSQKYDEALNFLEKSKTDKAWYYLAKIHVFQKKYSSAQEYIKLGLQKYSHDFTNKELADIMQLFADISSSKALAWDELCKISLNNKKIEDIALFNKAKYLSKSAAIESYKKITKDYIKGDYASEALKKMFWHEYKNKNYKVAKQIALKHINNFNDTKAAPQMNFWLGKIYEKENEIDNAKKVYNKILDKYPDDYYALRALGRLSFIEKGKDYGWQINPAGPIKQENFILDLPYTYSEIKTKFGATLAELLLVEDFNTIEYFYNFDEPFIESWIYYKKGLRSTSTTTARNAMEKFSEKPVRTDAKWRFVYPCYFIEDINKYSKRNKITPYLMISLIREESYFNPLALSASNAVGLVQILPSTAREVSERRGYGRINEFLLFNPETNIKFGTAYFSQLRQQFNNDIYAVAAYNGGAGSVTSWLKKNQYSDMDEFIENIPYPETQNYVKKVYRSYWNYVRIYAQ